MNGQTCVLCGCQKFRPYLNDLLDYEYRVKGSFNLIKCESCGLVRQANISSYSDLMEFYPPDYHAHQPAGKGLLSSLKRRLYLRRVRRIKKLVGGGKVLDVGCGNCSLLSALRELGGFELHGLDIKRLGVDYAGMGISFREGHLEDIGFEKDRFDLLSMDNVVEHVPDPDVFFKKAGEVIRPGGWIVGTTPNVDSVEARLYGKYWGPYHMPRHTYLFGPETLKAMLEKHGFYSVRFPLNAVSGCGISIQNYLRRNKDKIHPYEKAWYVPYLSLLTAPASYLLSLTELNSTLDFMARKK